jgi:uncharacterized protein YegP (UPF0339 family)
MFECYETESGAWRFRLKATNGQTILASQNYKGKDGCHNGIESVKENAGLVERFEKKVSENGKLYFNLMAGNGQVIGTSEMYESESGRDNGIDSVMNNAPAAQVVEVE